MEGPLYISIPILVIFAVQNIFIFYDLVQHRNVTRARSLLYRTIALFPVAGFLFYYFVVIRPNRYPTASGKESFFVRLAGGAERWRDMKKAICILLIIAVLMTLVSLLVFVIR